MIKIKLPAVDEIHEIREKLYEEEKGLSAEARIVKIKKESQETLQRFRINIKRRKSF